jgi:uncharacterized protein YcfJ
VFENLEGLAVDDLCDSVADCRDAVMQIHLPCRNVDRIVMLVMEAVATGERNEQTGEEQGGSAETPCWSDK